MRDFFSSQVRNTQSYTKLHVRLQLYLLWDKVKTWIIDIETRQIQ